jgi:hypothetical protein
MTVCIAAIAANNKAIVAVADKATSYIESASGRTVFKADAALHKMKAVMGTDWLVLIAGPMDFGERVADLGGQTYRMQKGEVIKGMPECMQIAYQVCRRLEAIDRILIPRMLTREWYESKVNGPVSANDEFFMGISNEVSEWNNGSQLILCGFEDGSPQIYLITNPGILNSANPEGFAAVGIGQETALNRLFALETDQFDQPEKVLYDLFDAKESCSEALPDVGRDWDASVVAEGMAPLIVSDDVKQLIEEIYDAYPKSPFPIEKKELPEKWRERLRDFFCCLDSR